jgi:hypothetical protein
MVGVVMLALLCSHAKAADTMSWEKVRALTEHIRTEAQAAPARVAGGFPAADLAPQRAQLASTLQSVIEERGVPRAAHAGQVNADLFWAALEETPTAFRESLKPRMLLLLEAGLADGPKVAQMLDGLAIEQGKKQIYGTVVVRRADGLHFAPIEDPSGLEARRRRAGLLPMTAYRNALQALHGQTVHALPDEGDNRNTRH